MQRLGFSSRLNGNKGVTLFKLQLLLMGICVMVFLAKAANAQCNSVAVNITGTKYFTSSSGTGSLSVTVPGNCFWTFSRTDLWLNATPSSGSGSQIITFQVNSNSGSTRKGGVGATVYDSLGTPVASSFADLLQVGQTPASISSVSSASFNAPVAPESNVSVFGSPLSVSTLSASSTPLPTVLGDVSVKVTDSANVTRDASLFYVSPTQINYQIPSGTAVGTATVRTYVSGITAAAASGTVQVASVAPGMYSANGSGSGIANGYLLRVKPNGTQITESLSNSIAFNGDTLYLVLYGTGIRFRSSLSSVTASIGGITTSVLFAGAQGSLVGVDQVNLGPLPVSLMGQGTVNINLTVDGISANAVQVIFQ